MQNVRASDCKCITAFFKAITSHHITTWPWPNIHAEMVENLSEAVKSDGRLRVCRSWDAQGLRSCSSWRTWTSSCTLARRLSLARARVAVIPHQQILLRTNWHNTQTHTLLSFPARKQREREYVMLCQLPYSSWENIITQCVDSALSTVCVQLVHDLWWLLLWKLGREIGFL